MPALHKLLAAEVRNADTGKHCDGGGLWLNKRCDGGAQWFMRFSVSSQQASRNGGGQPYRGNA